MHDLDEREAGGEVLDDVGGHCSVSAVAGLRGIDGAMPSSIASERAAHRAVAGGTRIATAAGIRGIALRQPVKPRVRTDAGFRLAMLGTPPPQHHALPLPPTDFPNFRRTIRVAHRTARGSALEEGLGDDGEVHT